VINEIKKDAEIRMNKSMEALAKAFSKVRTGRAHPSLLDDVTISYFDVPTPLKQLANIGVEEGRTLTVIPWEKPLIPVIEKAIMAANLGLNPSSTGELIRIPLPALTEETRKDFIKVVRHDAENARISVRSIRRDANTDIKELLKEKEISEDEERQGEEGVQKLTNTFVAKIDGELAQKEKDLMEV